MTNPTPEQIKAAYQAWINFPHKRGPQNAENAICAALVAAAGVTPQELSVDRVHAVLGQCSIEYHHPEYGIGLFTTCAGEIATELAAPVQVDEAKLPAVTRVTLAGRAGTLSAEHWDYEGVEILVQDDGRTLKVLPLRGGGQ